MSFDGLFTHAMTAELSFALAGGRINKIYQPYKNEIILTVRARGQNHKVLLSAHPSYARAQLTKEPFENPAEPPMFCMLLRKHLEGAVLERIEQSGLDRIVIFHIKGRDEIGDISKKQLIVEIMGRHSNIVLVDEETKQILDSIKHVPAAVNSYRTILPGTDYIFPPAQNKANPLTADKGDILRLIDFNSGKADKQLVSQFAGISPLLAREITFRAGLINQATLPGAFLEVMALIKNGQTDPAIMTAGDKEIFYSIPMTHVKGEAKKFPSLSSMLDRFYFGKAERDRVRQQSHDLERFIKNERDKNIAKIGKLEHTLEEAGHADRYQLLGELLTASLHTVKKGMAKAEVLNYYSESGKTELIPLDPRKTPSENAQAYFSKYQKAKNAVHAVQEQLRITHLEIDYFEGLLQQLETAAPRDIEEMREELAEEGYLKMKKQRGRKRPGNYVPQIEAYFAEDGTEILVGKNNKQNDYLTNKLAHRDEIWLHTKDIPGSHVVIRSREPGEGTLLTAANLAAYYSKARESGSVPVDYTKVKHVKKPNGAKPGFVIYDHQQTLYVTPDADLIRNLIRK